MKHIHTWDDQQPMRRRLPPDVLFVFGSNLRGVHGAGAALFAAKYFGAIPGMGEGPMGQSYAIPTKDHNIQTRPLVDIQKSIDRFIDFTIRNNGVNFFLTPIGCGRAGYQPQDIAPMLRDTLPVNCAIPESWQPLFPGFQFIPSGV